MGKPLNFDWWCCKSTSGGLVAVKAASLWAVLIRGRGLLCCAKYPKNGVRVYCDEVVAYAVAPKQRNTAQQHTAEKQPTYVVLVLGGMVVVIIHELIVIFILLRVPEGFFFVGGPIFFVMLCSLEGVFFAQVESFAWNRSSREAQLVGGTRKEH